MLPPLRPPYREVASPSPLTLENMKNLPLLLTAITLSTLMLTGCSSANTTSTQPETTSASNAPITTSIPSPSAAPVGAIGQAIENNGVSLTVHSATTSPTLSRNLSNYRQGSGYETYTDVPADQGGQYLLVKTTVENTGTAPMDLTCSMPIHIVAFDGQDRTFSTVEKLYEIQGNPECNKQLQPGFSSEMTYAYLVPQDEHITGVAFRTPLFQGSNEYRAVRF